ncbi:hypothetical protein [Emticicia fontis]
MIWIELRENEIEYNEGWRFKESAWAPTKKRDGSEWPFWNIIKQVAKGDIIFHLKKQGNKKKFLGYSTASTDGYIVHDGHPTSENHEWNFSKSYFKVDLENFVELIPEVNLSDFFSTNDKSLRNFFWDNRSKRIDKKRIFYVVQGGRLQCLNGAYFSEFGLTLSELLIGNLISNANSSANDKIGFDIVKTGVITKELKQRIGHQAFSEKVKRNYNYRCCYPGCQVEGKEFLIGGHIARWADNEEMRGNIGNGLALCLMHDKAFEKGLFTLTNLFKVKLINKENTPKWLNDFLGQGENLEIKIRSIDPVIEALRSHWKRIGFDIDAHLL